jgi:protein-L-isoaspartate(D-aspartate) O-methyltransferase
MDNPTELYSSNSRMQQLLAETVDTVQRVMPRIEISPAIVQAYGNLDRAEFLPDTQQQYAYQNQAGALRSKTDRYFLSCTSRPSMVLILLHLLDVRAGLNVAEVGTGSGEIAAILDNLGCLVHTIEYDPRLAERARKRLERLGHSTIKVYTGDGGKGIPEAAPFDRMVCTAGASSILHHLRDQLTDDGLLLHPFGEYRAADEMVHGKLALVPKHGQATILRLNVHFVPLMSPRPGAWTCALHRRDVLIPSGSRKAKALHIVRQVVGPVLPNI